MSYTFQLSVNGESVMPLAVGGRDSRMMDGPMLEGLVEWLRRIADGGETRASYRGGVLKVVTPAGNTAELAIPLSEEAFDGAGLHQNLVHGRTSFVHDGPVQPRGSQTVHVALPPPVPNPVEEYQTLSFHNPQDLSFRQVVSAAAAAVGTRPRPTVDTLLAVASQFVVDIREAERVYVRSRTNASMLPVMFDWRRPITKADVEGLQVQSA